MYALSHICLILSREIINFVIYQQIFFKYSEKLVLFYKPDVDKPFFKQL